MQPGIVTNGDRWAIIYLNISDDKKLRKTVDVWIYFDERKVEGTIKNACFGQNRTSSLNIWSSITTLRSRPKAYGYFLNDKQMLFTCFAG